MIKQKPLPVNTKNTSRIWSVLSDWRLIPVLVYELMLIAFLLAELGVSVFEPFRATNQVLLLIMLLFLPFILVASASIVRSVTVRVSGQELQIELEQLQTRVDYEIDRLNKDFNGQISSAEQILMPLFGGEDPNAVSRLQHGEIIIASKTNYASLLLAEIMAHQIEHKVRGVNCTRMTANGGTLKNFADLKFSWIDIYPEFSGTACQLFRVEHRNKSVENLVVELDSLARERHGFALLGALGLRDDYCLVMTAEKAHRLSCFNLSDLSLKSYRLAFGAYVEFLNRPDGYPGLSRLSGIRFASVETCGVYDRYTCLDQEEFDVGVGHGTDPELHGDQYVTLKDDLDFFPSYLAVPAVRCAVLEAYPEVEKALHLLRNKIDTNQMMRMVNELNARGNDPAIAAEIARCFVSRLDSNG